MDLQQQNTVKISKKKKSKPQTMMKNVLLTPYKRLWPILSSEHRKEFDDLFCSNLSLLVPQQQPKIPWSVLKDIPKEHRKEFRQKYRPPINIDINLRKSLIFGVNECTRALEQHMLLAVLISSSCNPEMMVNHIVRIAEKRRIAVLVIESLKETLKKLVGFSCVCLGFKKYANLNDLGKLKQIVDFIYTIRNMKIDNIICNKDDIKVNLSKIETKQCVDNENNNITNEITLEADNCQENPVIVSPNTINLSTITISDSPEINNSVEMISESPLIQNLNRIETSDITMLSDSPKSDIYFTEAVHFIEDSNDNAELVSDQCVQIIGTDLPASKQSSTIVSLKNIRSDFAIAKASSAEKEIEAGPYLYRTSTNKRVFEPPNVQAPQKNATSFPSSTDFISLDDNSGKYIPSIIKRMKASKKIKKNKKKKIKHLEHILKSI